MRNNISSSFNFNSITYSNIFSNYFVFVMQSSVGNYNSTNIYWFNFCYRCKSSSSSNLYFYI